MINSKLDFAYKVPLGAASLKMRGRLAAQALHILFHFLAGVGVAAFLLPEGSAIVVGSLALVTAMKALYDYIDAGAVKLGCVAAMVAGGLTAIGISQLM